MRINYHKRFLKTFNKLPVKIQDKFYQCLRIFEQDRSHPLLNNHSVDVAYPNWRSINITGDYRALYEPLGDDIIEFMKIGTHSELYG
jgi:addiction module RelE/StbE family toxin